jgi:hypothetical protein
MMAIPPPKVCIDLILFFGEISHLHCSTFLKKLMYTMNLEKFNVYDDPGFYLICQKRKFYPCFLMNYL